MEHPVQVVYLDVLLLPVAANFLFDWLLLWAAAEVTKTATTRRRLLAGALVGTVHYSLYLLSVYGAVGLYGLWRFPPFVGAVSLAMLATAFPPVRGLQRLVRIAGPFYVILFVSAGAGLAVGNLLANGGPPSPLVVNLTAAGTLLLVAELGWGALQRRLVRGAYLVPVEITVEGRAVRLTALLDTGNTLRDPLTGAPVLPVEAGALRPLFPEALWPDILALAEGDFSRIGALTPHGSWTARLRLIPFTSLGEQNGLLVGFKADAVRLLLPQAAATPGGAVIGLARHPVDAEGQYQALLPPLLLAAAEPAPEAPGTRGAHASSIQSSKGGNRVVDTIP